MIVKHQDFQIFIPDEYTNQKSTQSEYSLKERLERGMWEREEIELLSKYLEDSDSVLELGACIGFLGIRINEKIKGNSHTLIEANPNLIEVIERNKELNSSTFKIVNCMIGDPSKDSGIFNVSDFILGSSEFIKNGKGVSVKVKSLSDFTKDHNFLIIDIEGGEYKLISKNVKSLIKFDKLLIEFHEFYGFTGKDVARSIKALKNLGFNLKEKKGQVYMFSKK
jgi:FkbM family methyltransferase